MKTSFTFNFDADLKNRLILASEKKYTKMGPLINVVLKKWLDEFEGGTKEQKEEKKMIEECPYLPGEHEALVRESREWELYMVARGDFHTGFAENPPIYDLMPGKNPIYLTPDGKARDGRIFEGEPGPYPQFPTPLADARRAKEEEYRKKREEEEAKELEAPKEETQQEMEDREFEESLTMSMEENPFST